MHKQTRRPKGGGFCYLRLTKKARSGSCYRDHTAKCSHRSCYGGDRRRNIFRLDAFRFGVAHFEHNALRHRSFDLRVDILWLRYQGAVMRAVI
jgi:hypothetical protein